MGMSSPARLREIRAAAHLVKYGPDAGDQRGRHGNHAHGLVAARMARAAKAQDHTQRLLDRSADAANGCRVWTGPRRANWYGRILKNGTETGAHRLSYEVHVGPIPRGLQVCHRCDNPPCINPAHLFLGDHTANARDMFEKGRGQTWGRRSMTRADAERALSLVRSGVTQSAVAKKLGVGRTTIGAIVRGQNWSWAHAARCPADPTSEE